MRETRETRREVVDTETWIACDACKVALPTPSAAHYRKWAMLWVGDGIEPVGAYILGPDSMDLCGSCHDKVKAYALSLKAQP